MPFLHKLSPTNFSIPTWILQILLLFWPQGDLIFYIYQLEFFCKLRAVSSNSLISFFFISMNSWLFLISYRLKPNSIIFFVVVVVQIVPALVIRSSFSRLSSFDRFPPLFKPKSIEAFRIKYSLDYFLFRSAILKGNPYSPVREGIKHLSFKVIHHYILS